MYRPYCYNDTLFVRLPANLQRACSHGCECPWCREHPNTTPCWDALAVGPTGDTWPVHFPDLEEQIRKEQQNIAPQRRKSDPGIKRNRPRVAG